MERAMIEKRWETDAEKLTAAIEFVGDVTAPELEALIVELMVLRASMGPAVSLSAPTPNTTVGIGGSIAVIENPSIEVRALANDRTRLYVRNEGLGWFVINLTHDRAASIRDFLIEKVPASAGGGFVAGERGDEPLQ